MNIYFDLEFTGLQQNTSIISIGLASDNGLTFYAEFDYDESQIDDWIRDNVITHLSLATPHYKNESGNIEIKDTRKVIVTHLATWLNEFDCTLHFWGDCLAWDWVLFCELFGGARSIPKYIHYIPFDISTLFLANNINPDISRESYAELEQGDKHHALWDALITKSCAHKLLGRHRSLYEQYLDYILYIQRNIPPQVRSLFKIVDVAHSHRLLDEVAPPVQEAIFQEWLCALP